MEEFKISGDRSKAGGWAGYMPGCLFLGLGILVLLMPDLLRMMVASLLMGLGFLLVALAWQVKKGGRVGSFISFFQDRMGGPMNR